MPRSRARCGTLSVEGSTTRALSVCQNPRLARDGAPLSNALRRTRGPAKVPLPNSGTNSTLPQKTSGGLPPPNPRAGSRVELLFCCHLRASGDRQPFDAARARCVYRLHPMTLARPRAGVRKPLRSPVPPCSRPLRTPCRERAHAMPPGDFCPRLPVALCAAPEPARGVAARSSVRGHSAPFVGRIRGTLGDSRPP